LAADPLAPDLELERGRRAEGVACGEHDLLALALKVAGELSDGGGLADAVDADDEDHAGRGRERERAATLRGGEDLADVGFERGPDPRGIVELALLVALAERLQDLRRGADAEIGGEEDLFGVVEDRG